MAIRLSQNALVVLERRYLKKDREGKPAETPERLFKRVAHAVALGDTYFDPKADVVIRADVAEVLPRLVDLVRA